MQPKDVVWSLRTVLSEQPQRRAEAVQQGAQAIARVFADQQSVRHYYRMLWRATDAEFEGLPAFPQLEAAMCRTVDAMQEQGLRKPGAYLLKLLKEFGWMDAVYRRQKFTVDAALFR